MTINLTPIFEAVIALLATVITCWLVPYLKAHLSEKKYNCYKSIVEGLVFAAEKLYGAGRGEEKFRYVCEQLREKGYEVDASAIEAAVMQWLTQWPQFDHATRADASTNAITGANAEEKTDKQPTEAAPEDPAETPEAPASPVE